MHWLGIGGALNGYQAHADVSVVIPTRGRPRSVVRAIESVIAQTVPPREIVVVVDGPDNETVSALDGLGDARVKVLQHPSSRGAAAARNAGVAEAASPWIAFLDDDDEWLPGKLADQLAAMETYPDAESVVLATGVIWRTGSRDLHWPTRAPRPGEPVSEYLFVRNEPGEGFLATPTLFLSRELARAVPMPENLRLHEDFDWFLALESAGARFDVVMETLVLVDGGSARDSVSRSTTWRRSMSWAQSRRDRLGGRAFSAFCLTEVARRASAQGELAAAPHIFLAALRGSPRVRDLLRFLVIWTVPETVRWQVGRMRRSTGGAR